MIRQFLSALLVLVLAGIPTTSSAFEVTNAWARATFGDQKTSGAYMTVTSTRAARLVGVESPAAGLAEWHETTMTGIVMRMKRLQFIPLPAGEPVELRPGGYHVMLMDLKRPLKVGDRVPLTLRAEDFDGRESEQTVQVEIRAALPESRMR